MINPSLTISAKSNYLLILLLPQEIPSQTEFVTYLLNGLGPNYDSFVTSITSRTVPITSPQLYHLLLIHESRLSHPSRSPSPQSPFEPTANLAPVTNDAGVPIVEDDKVVHEAGSPPTEEDLLHITSPISLHPTNQIVPSAKFVVNQVT